MGISVATAKRHWAYARAWLYEAIQANKSRSSGLLARGRQGAHGVTHPTTPRNPERGSQCGRKCYDSFSNFV